MDMQAAPNENRPTPVFRLSWRTRAKNRRCPIPDQRLLCGRTADREAD